MFNAAVYAQFIRIHPTDYYGSLICLRFEVLGCADIEQPTLTCPSDVTVDTDNGSATVYVNYLDRISAVDNSGDIPTISPDPTATFPANLGIGANPFTFTATDSSGNADTCTFTITVQDIEQPTLTCPSDITVEAETGSATVLVDYSDRISANDNSGDIPTISPDPTVTFPADLGIGSHPFTFTATDSSGNADTCTFTITVQDIEQPTLTCPSHVTVDNDNGSAMAYVNYLDTISAVDNSETVPTISPDPTATFPTNLGIGSNPFTFTATDSSGNTDTCTFTITVQDIEQPTLTCPSDVTVDTDIGVATAYVDYSGNITASDNSEAVPTISPDPTEEFQADLWIGANSFTFTATDSSGNTDTCTFTITVQGCSNGEDEGDCSILDTDESQSDQVSIINEKEFKEFERNVVSQLADLQETGEEFYDETNYVGLAKIESVNGDQPINNSLERFNESKVEFALQVDKEGEVLIIAAYSNHTMKNNEVVNERVDIAGLDGKDVFRYLTDKIFSCNVYDITTLHHISSKMRFSIIEKLDYSYYTESEHVVAEPICLFYNETRWTWSDEGMMTTGHSQDQVSCQSDHLTSFSVLMKVTKSTKNDHQNKILSILTTVGLAISSIFLVVTLVIICCFKDLRTSDRYRIVRHIVIALLCANFFFFFLNIKHKNRIACSFLAGCLHYCMVVAISWMLILSTDIYLKVKHPFFDHEKRFSISRFIGWIAPAIFVGLTVALTREKYASEECWLDRDSGAIWAFVSPVVLVVLIVMIQLVVIGIEVFKKSKVPNQTQDEVDDLKLIKNLFIRLLLLTPVVGASWIFGVILVFDKSDAMEYIFVVVNSMQGFFIWLTQCCFSKEVRTILIQYLNRQPTPADET